MADDTVEGYFKEEQMKALGMTVEMNKDFERMLAEQKEKDMKEQGDRIAKKAIEEFKKKYPDWVKSSQ